MGDRIRRGVPRTLGRETSQALSGRWAESDPERQDIEFEDGLLESSLQRERWAACERSGVHRDRGLLGRGRLSGSAGARHRDRREQKAEDAKRIPAGTKTPTPVARGTRTGVGHAIGLAETGGPGSEGVLAVRGTWKVPYMASVQTHDPTLTRDERRRSAARRGASPGSLDAVATGDSETR